MNRSSLTRLTEDWKNSTNYKQLLPCTTGHFKLIKVRDRFMPIDENRRVSTISKDRETPVRSKHYESFPECNKSIRHVTNIHTNGQNEFFLHRITGRRQALAGIWYQVRWYVYVLKDDTSERPSNIPPHFMSRY